EEMGPRFVATAAQLARIKGDTLETTVLERASVSLLETGYDNWGNGTTFYTLTLTVPIPTYAAVEERRDTLEKAILRRLQEITRADVNNRITEVVISPTLADEARPEVDSDTAEGGEPLPTFWKPGFFRIFVSHVAAAKASAHRLKEALALYRVAAF